VIVLVEELLWKLSVNFDRNKIKRTHFSKQPITGQTNLNNISSVVLFMYNNPVHVLILATGKSISNPQ